MKGESVEEEADSKQQSLTMCLMSILMKNVQQSS